MALGVISLNYGLLERMFQHLFAAVGDLNDHQIAALFQRIPNNIRLMMIYELMAKTKLPEKIKDRVDYFCTGFKVCAENRHALMHSRIGGLFTSVSQQTRGIMFTKATRAGAEVVCPATLQELRTVADDIHAYSQYGSDVVSDVTNYKTCLMLGNLDEFWRVPLRDKPPSPTGMSWRSESDFQAKPLQPQPSQESP